MTIWSAWLQGRNRAPALSRRIFALWENLNPSRRLHVIEHDEAHSLLAPHGVDLSRLGPAHVADLTRLAVLAERGGVWVDATVLPTCPLESWLGEAAGPGGLFLFRAPGADVMISNWFIAADANHPLIVRWRDAMFDYFSVTKYWPTWQRALYSGHVLSYLKYVMEFRKARKSNDYSWFTDPARGRRSPYFPYGATHYNFAWVLRTNPELQSLWAAVPCRHAILPHVVQNAGRSSDPDTFRHCLDALLAVAPVHKLNNRDPAMLVAVDRVLKRVARGEMES